MFAAEILVLVCTIFVLLDGVLVYSVNVPGNRIIIQVYVCFCFFNFNIFQINLYMIGVGQI